MSELPVVSEVVVLGAGFTRAVSAALPLTDELGALAVSGLAGTPGVPSPRRRPGAYRRRQLSRLQGDRYLAETSHQQALRHWDEIGQRLGVAVSLEALGGLAADEGRPEHAVRLLAAARAYRKEGVGHIRPSAEQATFDADLASVQQGLSPEAFAAAWEQGLGLSLSEAVAYAAKGRGPRQRPTTGWASLTKAERDVALLAAEGLTNTEIGQRLFISPRTAKAHLGHIFAKLGVTSRRQLPREGQPRA